MDYDSHKNITVNQHYVPRCYMKIFATVIGSGKKEKAIIGTIDDLKISI